MWNPFRRKPAVEAFPTPKWPPIQSLDSIDVIGKRSDGGLDLLIVASQPIDDSTQTLDSIRRKVTTYLTALDLEDFQAEYSYPPREKTTIIISCEYPIHPTALVVIAQCRVTAAAEGVLLEARKSLDTPPITLPQGGNEMAQSICPATQSEQDRLAEQVGDVLGMLRARYGDVQLTQNEDDLNLLQQLHDEGCLQAGDEELLESVGIVFGKALAARTQLHWATVEWQGERVLSLVYPNTTVVVFPGSMIAKRINRGEEVDFASLFESVVAQVNHMKDDPDYQK